MNRLDDARTEFEHIFANELDDINVDGGYVTLLCGLATTATWLGDRRRAGRIYELLHPYRLRNHVAGNLAISGGAVSQYLAGVAAATGRLDEAEQLFRHAIAMDSEMGARPWLALALCGYARLLLARRRADDTDRAKELLVGGLRLGRELGMEWVVKWSEQLGQAQ